jgi:serine protease Do
MSSQPRFNGYALTVLVSLFAVLPGCGHPVGEIPAVKDNPATVPQGSPAASTPQITTGPGQTVKPLSEPQETVDQGAPAGNPGASVPQAGIDDASQPLAALSEAFREVARKVKPCVVQVSAEVRPGAGAGRPGAQISGPELEELLRRFGPLLELDPELQPFFRGRPFERRGPDYDEYNVPQPVSTASGWIYDDAGHIVTNHHVVAHADRIAVTFHDQSEAKAELVGSDPQTDVAVLQCDKDALTPARLATRRVDQGDIVLAVGSPFQYAFSVSQGIVSATGRRMGILGPHGYEDFIQTDAAINPGNSGGPVTNAQGEVVGMSTAIASRSGAFAGIGFAIPVEMIRGVVEELIQNGKVRRGYLGALISDDEDLLASFDVQGGVLIEDIIEGGPADQAGLKPGDVIVELGGEATDSAAQLRQRIAHTDPGETVDVEAVREGESVGLEVTLAEQPSQEEGRRAPSRPQQPRTPTTPGGETLGKLGFEQLQTLTDEVARQYRTDQSEGVLVLAVRPFSAAAAAGIRRGQIITHVIGQRVRSVEELARAVEDQDLEKGVRLRVRMPGGPARFVLLSLGD